MRCYACAAAVPPDLAFVMGIAFRAQFNAEAMEARLCAHHKEMLEKGAAGAAKIVPPEARR